MRAQGSKIFADDLITSSNHYDRNSSQSGSNNSGKRFLATSTRTLHVVLHGNVGTIQLLRDAGVACVVYGGQPARRHGVDGQNGHFHLRTLHGIGVSDVIAGRLARGSNPRRATRSLVW